MKLYIVATPIGNLKDLSFRAVEVLQTADVILCEDTRHSRILFKYHNINRPLFSFHQHSSGMKLRQVRDMLREGKQLAYVSDAGTPGISDPGGRLVEYLVDELGQELEVVPIPGPAAVIAALSISGFRTDSFLFLGFIPHKKGRQKFLQNLIGTDLTTVFYESVHRIEKLLRQLTEFIPERDIMVARELTKQHESVYRGKPAEVSRQLAADKVKGEFVIVISAKKNPSEIS